MHTGIHLTLNKVLWRLRAFALSLLVLLAYWVVLGVELARNGAVAG